MPAFFYVVVFLLLAACAAPSDQMTSSEAEAFKRQISACWRLPEGTPEDMVVQVPSGGFQLTNDPSGSTVEPKERRLSGESPD
jgi:hypothetical protein